MKFEIITRNEFKRRMIYDLPLIMQTSKKNRQLPVEDIISAVLKGGLPIGIPVGLGVLLITPIENKKIVYQFVDKLFLTDLMNAFYAFK